MRGQNQIYGVTTCSNCLMTWIQQKDKAWQLSMKPKLDETYLLNSTNAKITS